MDMAEFFFNINGKMETEKGIFDLSEFQSKLENYDPVNPEKMKNEDGTLCDEIWEIVGNLSNQEMFYKVAKEIAPDVVKEILDKIGPVSVGNDMIKRIHMYSGFFTITVNIDDPGYKDGALLDVSRKGNITEKLYLYKNELFIERTHAANGENIYTTFSKYEFIN